MRFRPGRVHWVALALSLGSALAPHAAGAASDPVRIVGPVLGGREEISSALRIFVLLTALSVLPAALICMTSFVRIVIVLSMLRHALGMQDTPPNVVLVSLALFLTLFSMAPTIEQVNQQAFAPYSSERITLQEALRQGKAPVKDFMVRQTRESDLMLMVELAGVRQPESLEDLDLVQLIPAFMLSELRTAFQVGFVVFLPFLLVDLIVSSVLMALGMMMVPPAGIAIPIKILLFVLIDGWSLLVRSLLGTFA